MLTLFEICKNGLEGLKKQGKRAGYYSPDVGGDGFRCLYRGPEDTKCFIGFSIPDELYTPIMEGQSAMRLSNAYPQLGFTDVVSKFGLGLLQRVAHDNNGFTGRRFFEHAKKVVLQECKYKLSVEEYMQLEAI